MKNSLPAAGDNAELVWFLIAAKRHTYAAKSGKTESSRPNSHDLAYREGEYFYLDTYLGSERFAGEEAVWQGGKPICAMNYCGRVLDGRFSGDFLKAALYRVPLEKPFRGPECYQEGEYLYRCTSEGDLDWFQGYEEIYLQNAKVYECYFHGGLIT